MRIKRELAGYLSELGAEPTPGPIDLVKRSPARKRLSVRDRLLEKLLNGFFDASIRVYAKTSR